MAKRNINLKGKKSLIKVVYQTQNGLSLVAFQNEPLFRSIISFFEVFTVFLAIRCTFDCLLSVKNWGF